MLRSRVHDRTSVAGRISGMTLLFTVILAAAISTDASAARKQNPTDQVSQALKQAGLKELENEVVRQLGQAIEVGAPLRLDHRTAYPPTTVPIDNFQPKKLELTPETVRQPLDPGDYSIDVIGYCTRWSLHYPGRGLPYKLARLEGRAAEAISDLLWRGTLKGVRPQQLSMMAWRIQGGVPLSKWRPQEQELVHQLIPEHEAELNGDFLEQTRSIYDKAAKLGKLPKYEAMLGRLGPVGETVLDAQQARRILANKTLAAERMPDLLYGRPRDGLPRILNGEPNDPPSEWSEIAPGVYARLTIIQGNMGRNVLDLRIIPHIPVPPAANISRRGYAIVPVSTQLVEDEPHPPRDLFLSYHSIPPGTPHEDFGEEPRSIMLDLLIYISKLLAYANGRPAQALILVPDCPHPGTHNCGWGEIGIRG